MEEEEELAVIQDLLGQAKVPFAIIRLTRLATGRKTYSSLFSIQPSGTLRTRTIPS
jgi:hypothetical protein